MTDKALQPTIDAINKHLSDIKEIENELDGPLTVAMESYHKGRLIVHASSVIRLNRILVAIDHPIIEMPKIKFIDV